MEVKRVARLVQRTEADAWVVGRRLARGARVVRGAAGAGLRPVRAAARAADRRRRAGQGASPRAATRRLIELGHRRIVLLARRRGGCRCRGAERAIPRRIGGPRHCDGPLQPAGLGGDEQGLSRVPEGAVPGHPADRADHRRGAVSGRGPAVSRPGGACGCRRMFRWSAPTATRPSPGASRRSPTSAGTAARWCGGSCAGRPT